jgi:hypothetical protein
MTLGVEDDRRGGVTANNTTSVKRLIPTPTAAMTGIVAAI